MKELTEKFEVVKVDDIEEHCIIMACRDYEAKDEERWVLACLSKDEARKVLEKLTEYLS